MNLFHKLPIRVFLFCSLALLAVMSGCDSGEPDDDAGENELITRVTLILTPVAGGDLIIAEAEDPDGDGANLTIDSLQLTSGAIYQGEITLFDGVNNEDITAEVEDEEEEHQFWYTAEGGIADRVTVAITDTDANDLPVGLAFTVSVSVGADTTGTMNVVLNHYEEGEKEGTDRSDETDIDIDFPVSIIQ
ncbi:MAG: hypothetical protein SH809_06065 [Rhodothermales bacterium]|nr:hypothetical protein [Rhodothermales bacterium]